MGVVLAAVMKDKVGTALAAQVCGYSALDTTKEIVARTWLPVAYDDVPEDDLQVQFSSGAKEIGSACSVGWTEELDRSAEDVFDGLAGCAKLLKDEGVGVARQPGVMHGVIADGVAGGLDLPGECRLSQGVVADEKEGRARLVACKNFKQQGSYGRVGSVIEREGQLGWQGRRDERRAEELRLVRQAPPGTGCRDPGQGRGGSDECRRKQHLVGV